MHLKLCSLIKLENTYSPTILTLTESCRNMHWIFKTEGQRENFLANVSLKTNLLFRVVSMKSLQDEFSKITAKQC
jgi:hypothetical protein